MSNGLLERPIPAELAKFKPGNQIPLLCYKEGCELVGMNSWLGEEFKVVHGFTQAGRFRWASDTPIRGFDLAVERRCPVCGTFLSRAIIVSNGPGKEPTIFGYGPKPA